MNSKWIKRLSLLSFFVFTVWFVVCPTTAFDFDGKTDILWHNNASGTNAVWHMNGAIFPNTLGSVAYLPSASGTNWEIAATADFNRDGLTDVLWRDNRTGENAIWLMSGVDLLCPTGCTVNLTRGDVGFYVVGTGDFNGDGFPDILWRHRTQDQTSVWFMDGPKGTNFSGVGWIQGEPDLNWLAAATGDFNNDGHADILWRNKVSGHNTVWLMNGTNLVSGMEIMPETDLTKRITGTGQFNRTGKTDILWRDAAGNNSIWLMGGKNGGERIATVGFTPVGDTNWVIAGTGGYIGTILLGASVTDSPPSITLGWRYGIETLPTVKRKTPDAMIWTNVSPASYTPVRFTNFDVVIGQRYEYMIDSVHETNYLSAGFNLAPVEKRGRVLLLVDKTLATNPALATQLAILREDLVGDGWIVFTNYNAPRHVDDYSSAKVYQTNAYNVTNVVKPLIRSFYVNDPTRTNVVFIIGHVAIPYAGSTATDGHTGPPNPTPDHRGAWAADAYYGDTNDVLWADVTVSYAATYYGETSNFPGDGKFDNNSIPSALELAVGRVDFARMPDFYYATKGPKMSEIDLLVQYLKKDHNYRHKKVTFAERAVVNGAFGNTIDNSLYANALRNGSRWFGIDPGNVVEGDLFIQTATFLWGFAAGAGGAHYITRGYDPQGQPRLRTTQDLTIPTNEPPIGFFLLQGSYLADWNLSTNNITRACLATPNYGLAAIGISTAAEIAWHLESLALGEPIGVAFQRACNLNPFAHRWFALMGDPTLRLKVTAPPAGLFAKTVNTGTELRWNPSPETGVQYYVYRSSTSLTGPWTSLTITSSTNYTDSPAPPGAKTYQVRASKLALSGSGSYTNLSQGIFADVN